MVETVGADTVVWFDVCGIDDPGFGTLFLAGRLHPTPGILYDHGANIINLEQHVEPDEKLFFMRIHADLKNMEIFWLFRLQATNL